MESVPVRTGPAICLGISLAAAALLLLVGCDPPERPKPEFVRGDEVLLAPDDAPALVLYSDCTWDRHQCAYRLRLPGLKEKTLYSSLGMRKKP
jgi:hypothetical protein